MSTPYPLLCLCILLLMAAPSSAQTSQEQAAAKAKEAIRIEDEQQKYDEAIRLLEEACRLDPGNINYPYEIAYSYTAKKEYKKASDLLETLLNHKEVYGQVYQALGNAYDYQGLPEKAIATYEAGLKKFPDAGPLYLEMGNMKMVKKEYGAAIEYYEKGIEMDPQFPSNYYWAARLYCSSEDEVWGMLYGEIFMNLERNSRRTAEISQLLYNTYKSQIKFNTASNSISVSFSKNATMTADNLKDPAKFRLPFSLGVYEPMMAIAVASEKSIDLNSLDRIRSNFLDQYFNKDIPEKYPNILLDYQESVKEAGHLEAYNHWILMKGDEDAFTSWQKANSTKWDNFTVWFSSNAFNTDRSHRFFRKQY